MSEYYYETVNNILYINKKLNSPVEIWKTAYSTYGKDVENKKTFPTSFPQVP